MPDTGPLNTDNYYEKPNVSNLVQNMEPNRVNLMLSQEKRSHMVGLSGSGSDYSKISAGDYAAVGNHNQMGLKDNEIALMRQGLGLSDATS